MSEKSRPERRRASRDASHKSQTKARPAPPRRPAATPSRPVATPSRPVARSSDAGFLDYLIIALLVFLGVMIVAGLLVVIRGGF